MVSSESAFWSFSRFDDNRIALQESQTLDGKMSDSWHSPEFTEWFWSVLRTGDLGEVQLGVSPQRIIELWGETPHQTVVGSEDMVRMAYVGIGMAMEFYFEDSQGGGAGCSTELYRMEESGIALRMIGAPRIQCRRQYFRLGTTVTVKDDIQIRGF